MSKCDSILISKFEELIKNNSEYWDFKESKKDHIHGIFTYPATMVPSMQSKILEIILKYNPNIDSLLDPFMGSGTMLVEGMINNLNIYGIDINPLSYLISKFKINVPVINELNTSFEILLKDIDTINSYPIISFKNIDKWYKKEIIYDLSKINYCIKKISNIELRTFFWICLAEISRLCNNSRNSTFKLHIKSKDDIENFKFDVIQSYKKLVLTNINRIQEYIKINKNLLYKHDFNTYNYNKEKNIYLGNSINILKEKFRDNSIELIITSPPYGDNPTTVTYGQFSILPLRWIDINDLNTEIEENLISIDSKIDSLSLGGKNYSYEYIKESNILNESETLNYIYNYLIFKNEKMKARKVASFILDFRICFKELIRILNINGYMVLTVGNRRVANNIIEFNKIIKEFSMRYGVTLVYEFNRNIIKKRLPTKVSKLKDNTSVNSMSKEYILILKKQDNKYK
ncbi:site-specific DNA-methyltransferase [Clostridium sp. ZBS2]|uniref:site-specific DNA-methyltransferase n=1 Tax=Clostridium sp. ZBS2 TaxID=2949976 RepID=UPI002079F3BC|nr:site-specific DNA-methyltransferase [Clostridium sp. ZBS2]